MKKFFFAFGHFLLFLFVFLAGSLANPFHLKWFVVYPTPMSTHYFVPDGLLLMIALYIVIFIIQGIRKRLATSGILTSIAVFLAYAAGHFAKFGYVTKDPF